MGATSLDLSQIKTDVLSAASTFRTLIGLGSVNNTADLDKPISTATQEALDLKADSSDLSSYLPLTGGTLTGGLGGTTGTFSGAVSGSTVTTSGSSISDGLNYATLGSFVSLTNFSRFFSGVNGSIYLSTGQFGTGSIFTAGTGSNNGALHISSANLSFVNPAAYFGWRSSIVDPTSNGWDTEDVRLYRDAPNTLGLRRGANAQRFNLYGTYTDASNYRRFYITSTTAGAFTLGVEGLGTGASDNTLRVANSITMPTDYTGITTGAFGALSLRGNVRTWNLGGAYPDGLVISGSTGLNTYHLAHFMMPNEGVSGAGFNLASSVSLGWYNGDPNTTNSNTVDGRIIRNTTGQLDVRADNGLRFRNLANNAFSDLQARTGTFNTNLNLSGAGSTFAPASFGLAVYRNDNGQFQWGHSYSQGFLIAHGNPSIGFAQGADSAPDAKIVRNATGPAIETRSTGGLRVVNLTGSANASITSGPIEASTVSSTNKGLVVRGSAAQSANLVEVQDVSQNVLASIDKDGDVVANSGSFHTVQLTSDTPRQSGVLFLDNNKLLTTSTNFIHDNSNLASPKLIFKASGNATPDISLNVLTSASGSSSGVQTLSFEGSAGQLFSVSDVLNSGTIFGVNDISGLPLLEVDATGLISLARFGTNIVTHTPISLGGTTSSFPSIRRNGSDVRFRLADNSADSNVLAKGIYFNGGNAGIKQTANNFLVFDIGGNDRGYWGGDFGVPVGSEGYTWVNGGWYGTKHGFFGPSSHIVELRGSTNPQTFRIYNAFTDASNYDRAFARWNSNVFEIGTERAGTYSTTRSLSFVFNGTTRGSLSPTGGFWVGSSNTATDQSSVICGMYSTANIPYSAIVGGMRGNTYLYGQTVVAFGGRPFNAGNYSGGVCQSWLLTLSGYTTDATQTRMRAGDTSETWDYHQRLTVRSGYTVSYLACIKGIKSDGTARARFWRLIDITRIGNTTALDVAAETLGTDHNPSSCTITIQADDTNEAMEILVGGVAGETWRWTGTLYATEMQYGT